MPFPHLFGMTFKKPKLQVGTVLTFRIEFGWGQDLETGLPPSQR